MPDKAVHLFVMEGFADWEPAHATAELRRHGGFRVESNGDVEFARELFEELNVLTPAERAAWAAMFRSARLP